MRRFVVLGHDAPTTPDFSLEDLPGGAGRLDVLCRCISAALLRSHGVREDTEIVLILGDSLAIRFEGAAIRHLHPDERSTAARIRTAIEAAADAIGAIEVEAAPGLSVAKQDFSAILAQYSNEIVQLDPAGEPLSTLDPSGSYTFVLSDHHPFTNDDREVLAQTADRTINLGPVALHADHAIVIAHNYLDTQGFEAY